MRTSRLWAGDAVSWTSAGREEPADGYDDIGDPTHADGMDRARDLGLASEVARVRFDADRPLRRDQMASVLARTSDALEREGVLG